MPPVSDQIMIPSSEFDESSPVDIKQEKNLRSDGSLELDIDRPGELIEQ
jgi:hypothetical protein